MYVGKIVWNRQRFVKDPDTGKRQARPNPESEWVKQEAPELRILEDESWQAVKARQAENTIERDDKGCADVGAINTRRRPKYLFSGLTKCACCGGGYSAISATLIGCSTARNKGTCENRVNIRRDELESRVLGALRSRMLDPKIFAEFCDAYTQETNRLRMESRANIAAAQAEIERIGREEERLMDLYLKEAISIEAVKERGDKLKLRKAELNAFLGTADEPHPLLHPAMAQLIGPLLSGPKSLLFWVMKGVWKWGRGTRRKRLSASCVRRRSCWRKAGRRAMPADGSRLRSRPIIGGARNMVV